MPDHRIFQRLLCQLRATRSFHVTRHDAGRLRAVRSLSLEERILNVVSGRPESSTRAVAQHELLSHGQTQNLDLYCQQLDCLKLAIDQKWPELANRRGAVFNQDKA
ncbi:hypothetical protein TNCV_3683121 [Trichonephila clavipes]|nr:hypothetical protein TNCV_3683121 [Trichonephila clavipes]